VWLGISETRSRDFIIAILAAILALTIRHALNPHLDDYHVYVLPLLAVIVVAWYGGFVTALITLFLSVIGVVYFFVNPTYSFLMDNPAHQLGMVLYIVCGVATALLGESQRQARLRAERHASKLQEANSQLDRAQRESATNLAHLEAFLAHTPIGLAFLDTKQRYVRVNEYWANANKLTPSDYLGKQVEELRDNLSPHLAAHCINVLRSDKPILDFHIQTMKSDTESLQWSVNVYPVRSSAGLKLGLAIVAQDVTDKVRATSLLAERAKLAALRGDLSALLATDEPVQRVLQNCVELIVNYLDVAFARIWTLNESEQILELQASAGLYTHLDGPHSRVKVGQFKIGRIAESRQPHLTNNVPDDPNISDHEWARREGMIAFAGYPLLVGGRVVGVLAMFSRNALSDVVLRDLAPLSNSIAQWISRQQALIAVRESERRFRHLADAIPQIVWITRPDGYHEYYNSRWYEYTGMTPAESIGWGWSTPLHPEDKDRSEARWKEATTSGDPYEIEYRFRRADGIYRWFIGRAVPIRSATGEIVRWFGTCTDIDDQKRESERLEEMVRERTTALSRTNTALQLEVMERRRAEERERAAAVELRRSNEELEKFAYVASHDLQEPLRKIQAFGDRLSTRCQNQLSEQGAEYLERILSSAGRMRRLIDDLLTFSRVTTKTQPFAPVDLNEVLAEVVADLEARLIQVDGRIEVNPLPTIEADQTQMRQLFQNLIGNALKFRRADTPPVVSVCSVEWNSLPSDADPPRPSGQGWRITVADNGIGFDQQFVGRIFEVFQRLHGRGEYEGTGIGLAICRKIVERHGGVIAARSQPDHGATFIIDLPATLDEAGTLGHDNTQTSHDIDGGR
jgi:PAS domain S-box-containing protein